MHTSLPAERQRRGWLGSQAEGVPEYCNLWVSALVYFNITIARPYIPICTDIICANHTCSCEGRSYIEGRKFEFIPMKCWEDTYHPELPWASTLSTHGPKNNIKDMKARRIGGLLGCPRKSFLFDALDRNSTAHMKRVSTGQVKQVAASNEAGDDGLSTCMAGA